jgi:hypothetical protein
MAQYGFGSGTLFGYRTDVAVATPVQFGALQDVSLDFQFAIKELHGQYQFPLAVARSTAKVTGKAKFAQIGGRAFNDLFFGQALTTGQKITGLNEAANVPASPFQVTVANAATFVEDLGAVFAATGSPLIRVASAPAAGQYAASGTGVYTFAAADTGKAVLISYTYTTAATGQRITIANQLIGSAPTFKVVLSESYQGKVLQVELNQCVSTKLMLPTKHQDFIIPEIDFEAFVDAAGNLGSLSVAETS